MRNMTAAATTALPEGWTTRRPTLDDVPAILAMVHASDIAAVGEPDFLAEEVREILLAPNTDMTRDSWLALDADGTVLGWTFPHNASGGDRDYIEVYTWPERGLPALRPLLALIMERVAERAAELGHDPYQVRAGGVPTELALIEALTEAGFVFLKQHARMQMSLADVPATAPEPPPGIVVRPVRSGDEAEMRVFHAVIEESFRDTDHHSPDYDAWRQQLSAQEHVPYDEWFVAEADGRIVGALQSAGAATEEEGWVSRLGVLRAYRKRGIGEALLRRVFAVYVANGRTRAGLGVDLENPTAAARLYLAVGMTAKYRANIYRTYVTARAA